MHPVQIVVLFCFSSSCCCVVSGTVGPTCITGCSRGVTKRWGESSSEGTGDVIASLARRGDSSVLGVPNDSKVELESKVLSEALVGEASIWVIVSFNLFIAAWMLDKSPFFLIKAALERRFASP